MIPAFTNAVHNNTHDHLSFLQYARKFFLESGNEAVLECLAQEEIYLLLIDKAIRLNQKSTLLEMEYISAIAYMSSRHSFIETLEEFNFHETFVSELVAILHKSDHIFLLEHVRPPSL